MSRGPTNEELRKSFKSNPIAYLWSWWLPLLLLLLFIGGLNTCSALYDYNQSLKGIEKNVVYKIKVLQTSNPYKGKASRIAEIIREKTDFDAEALPLAWNMGIVFIKGFGGLEEAQKTARLLKEKPIFDANDEILGQWPHPRTIVQEYVIYKCDNKGQSCRIGIK